MSGESARLKQRGRAVGGGYRASDVAEIGAGTLPHPTFRFCFEQNLSYLHEYARAIAMRRPGPRTGSPVPMLPTTYAYTRGESDRA